MLLSTEFNPLNALFSVRLFPHKHSISAPLRDRKRKGAFLYIVSFRRSLGLCRNRAPLSGNSPGIDTESLLSKLPANGFSLFYFPFPSVPDRQISGTAAVVRDRGSLAIYQIFPFRVWKMTKNKGRRQHKDTVLCDDPIFSRVTPMRFCRNGKPWSLKILQQCHISAQQDIVNLREVKQPFFCRKRRS